MAKKHGDLEDKLKTLSRELRKQMMAISSAAESR